MHGNSLTNDFRLPQNWYNQRKGPTRRTIFSQPFQRYLPYTAWNSISNQHDFKEVGRIFFTLPQVEIVANMVNEYRVCGSMEALQLPLRINSLYAQLLIMAETLASPLSLFLGDNGRWLRSANKKKDHLTSTQWKSMVQRSNLLSTRNRESFQTWRFMVLIRGIILLREWCEILLWSQVNLSCYIVTETSRLYQKRAI